VVLEKKEPDTSRELLPSVQDVLERGDTNSAATYHLHLNVTANAFHSEGVAARQSHHYLFISLEFLEVCGSSPSHRCYRQGFSVQDRNIAELEKYWHFQQVMAKFEPLDVRQIHICDV